MERTCKKCGETKPIEEFKKDKSVKSGHGLTCKICYNNENRLYKLYHIDEVRRKAREYAKRHRFENLELMKQRRRQFYINHKEEELKAGNEWKNNHRKEIAAKLKQNISELSDGYIVAAINHSYGLKASTVRQHPELIKLYRYQIEHHREYKQLQQSLKILQNETLTNC